MGHCGSVRRRPWCSATPMAEVGAESGGHYVASKVRVLSCVWKYFVTMLPQVEVARKRSPRQTLRADNGAAWD